MKVWAILRTRPARSSVRLTAALGFTAILLLGYSRPARAVGRVTAAAGPCSLYVYSDETWSGCDDLPADAPERPLLARAARSASAMMRAWRRREPVGLLPPLSEVPGEADSTDRVAHAAILSYLQRELTSTITIDSMAVRFRADPSDSIPGRLDAAVWIARLRQSGSEEPTPEIDYFTCRTDWKRGPGGWSLRRISGFDPSHWSPSQNRRVPAPFPPRPPRPTDAAVQAGALDSGIDRPGRLQPVRWWNFEWIDHPPAPATYGHGDEGAESAAGSAVLVDPVPVTTVPPVYPEFAREAQIEGRVVLAVFVGASGRVESVRLVKGVIGLNEAAMDAVRKWVFKPATDPNGSPVGVWTRIPLDFHR